MTKKNLAAILIAAMSQLVEAKVTGTGQAGYVMTRGNTDSETANAKLDLGFLTGLWRNNLGLAGLYGRGKTGTNAQRWDSHWQIDRKFDHGYYWFTGIRYEDDEFSGFDYQSTVTAGCGHDFLNDPSTKLHVQIGAGYRSLRPEQLVFDPNGVLLDRIKGERQTHVIGNAAINFEHTFNDATKLLNTASIESGPGNNLTRDDLALQVKMTKLLAVSLGWSLRNNSNPPPLLRGTDTLTTVNLVYSRQ
jgi:putative salt-induced outer membrane protein